MINHFLTEQADRLEVFRGSQKYICLPGIPCKEKKFSSFYSVRVNPRATAAYVLSLYRRMVSPNDNPVNNGSIMSAGGLMFRVSWSDCCLSSGERIGIGAVFLMDMSA